MYLGLETRLWTHLEPSAQTTSVVCAPFVLVSSLFLSLSRPLLSILET
jgi:hypothetical protein